MSGVTTHRQKHAVVAFHGSARQAAWQADPGRHYQTGRDSDGNPDGGGVSGFGAARESETDCDVRAEKPVNSVPLPIPTSNPTKFG